MPRLTLALAAILGATFAHAQSNCRLYLASQYSWEGKTGFYLDFEGARLEGLPLILGVADGNEWRFTSHAPGFEIDRPYKLQAVIEPKVARLLIDGAEVGRMDATLSPSAGPLEINYRPSWANEKGDWLAIASRVRVSVTRGDQEVQVRDFDFTTSAARAVALQFFEPGTPSSSTLDVKPGGTVTIDIDLRFENNDLHAFAPFVDPYGQAVHADYPTKVKSD